MTGRRLIAAVPVVLGVTFIVFLLASFSPYDPLQGYLGVRYQQATSEQLDQLREALGLNIPFWTAWWHWLVGIVHGDWGMSRSMSRPVIEVIALRVPLTALLTAVALIIAFFNAAVGALVAARRPGGLLDRTLVAITEIVQGTPGYLIAIGTLIIFAVHWKLIPAGGAAPAGEDPGGWSLVLHGIGPAVVLGITMTPWPYLQLREGLLRALSEPHIVGARMRGVQERTVIWRHALSTATLPVIGLLGALIPELITGAVLIETVFTWPGIANALVEAAINLDFPLLAGITLLTTLVALIGTWLSDSLLILLDPRVRIDG